MPLVKETEMAVTLRSLVVAAAAALSVTPGLAAQEARPIQERAAVSASLAGDEAHTYTLALDSAMWVFGVADQVSVDVVVTILGPDGEEIVAFDGPSVGPEYFQFDTETAGVHMVRVTAFEEGSGDYHLEIRAVERVATDPDDRLDQMLRAWDRDDGPGVLAGIVEGGQLRTVRALGMANLTHRVPMTPETRSNIGSVTKQFTAMALLLLEQDGELSLSDDIRTHIPELPDFGSVTTLKNLLNHTGGYREVYNFLPLAGYQGEDGFRREQVVEIVQRQQELQSAPGSEFNYNNTGYILLSMVVERVSGLSFPDFVAQRIFAPLGMRDSRVKDVQGEIIANSAQGYVPDDAGWRQARDLASSAGAGGIYSTLEDLAAYMTNYRDATVGGRSAVEAVTTRAVLSNGDTTAYGLGMGVGRQRGRVRFQHTGGDVAHRTYFGYWPELDAGVLLMSNDASFPLGMGMQIAEVYWNDRFDPDTTAAPVVADGASVSAERLEALAGDWIVEGPQLPVEFRVEDGVLVADPQGQTAVRMTATSDSTFEHTALNVRLMFYRESDGSVRRATFTQGSDLVMRRVDEGETPALDAEALAAYGGSYWSDEIETRYEVRVSDGTLVIDSWRMAPITLTHAGGDQFSGPFPLTAVEFRRAGNGTITGFVAGNGRTRDVWFRRQ
jgi:CubicO group peptidase (beta-lactamase class C family)